MTCLWFCMEMSATISVKEERKTTFGLFLLVLVCREFMFYFLSVYLDVYSYQTQFPYQMMILSNNDNTTGATSGTRITLPFRNCLPFFRWCSSCSVVSFLYSVLRALVVALSVFFWPLFCLPCLDIRLLVTLLPKLVSLNISYRENLETLCHIHCLFTN